MSWLLGAGMGFLRGGPLGAIVGGSIQHWTTRKFSNRNDKNLPGIEDRGVFVTSLIVVLTKVALAKGSLTSNEVQIIYQFFIKNLNYKIADLQLINEIIDEARKLNPDTEPFVKQYRKSSQNLYNQLLLALAYQVGLAEGGIIDASQETINQLAGFLGIDAESHQRMRNKYSLGAWVTPYSILGVETSASFEEIKKAYRNRAAEFHPDRVAHIGKERAEEAHLKFLQIQSAYEELECLKKGP